MGIFEASQSVVNSAAGVIVGQTSIDISSVVGGLESRLSEMDLGPLFGLWFQSLFVGLCTWAITICIFIITYGRMIEVFLVTSVAPIPMATMVNREWGQMGQERLKVCHDILRMDTPEPFLFRWEDLPRSGLSTKDYIAPSSFYFGRARDFRMGKKFATVSFAIISLLLLV